MQFNIKHAELSDGIELEYVEQGDASGIPVIFLHGITDSWRSFELLLPHLPESIRAFAVTQRGHGDSDRPARGYLPQDFAADVAKFMDAVGLAAAIIVGHSMGSFVTQRFAIDYPERASSIALIGSFVNCLSNETVKDFAKNDVSKLADPIPSQFVREFQESTFAQPIPAPFLETVVQESLKVPARVWKEAFEGIIGTDFSDKLGKISAPTLILWGDRDLYFPRGDQETLAANIADSELLVYSGIGHTPHWEIPEITAADLVSFVESQQNRKAMNDVFRKAKRTSSASLA